MNGGAEAARLVTEEPDPVALLAARARQLLKLHYPAERYPGLRFDAPRWDLRPFDAARAEPPGTCIFWEEDGPPMPAAFAEAVKAYAVLSGISGRSISRVGLVGRALWATLSARLEPGEFRWSCLRPGDLEQTEAVFLGNGRVQGTVANRCSHLKRLLDWLVENDLVDAIEWSPITQYASRAGMGTAARKARLDRLPSRRLVEGLAEIYAVHAREYKDRLLICATGLLLITGLRVSELMSLPFDCVVRDVHRGRPRMGLRFWKRKSDGAHQFAVRWLSPLGAQLAERLLAEVFELTAGPRAQARVLEADQMRVAIPWADAQDELTTGEVERALGYRNQKLRDYPRYKEIRAQSRMGPGRSPFRFYSRLLIESELLALRGPLHSFESPDGQRQMLSDTLFVVFSGGLLRHQRIPQELLVEHVTASHLRTYLTGSGESRSVFAHFGIREPADEDGESSPIRARPHMLRHWINTIANKAGMSALQITIWMQRADIAQTMLYLHSASDIADLTRDGIRDGRVAGAKADGYAELPAGDREAYLAATIHVAHKTATGLCTADFGVDQCDRHKACEAGCEYFLCVPGDEQERAALSAKRTVHLAALRRLSERESAGVRVVPRQKQVHMDAINRIDVLLGGLEKRRVC